MAMLNPYSKYAQNSVNTAPQEELTLMLYEGALKFTNQAIMALENKDFGKTNDLILRVEDIIREFQVTLDRKYPIAVSFDALYDYMHRQLVQANMTKNKAILEEVRDMLREFRDMWKEAMALAKA